MKEVQLREAKASLSALIDRAVAGEPALITRHGRKEAVVLSFAEYQRLANVPSFEELLAAFPGGDIAKAEAPRDTPSSSYSFKI